MATNRSNVKYIYDLPYFERKELCRILDHSDKWEELGGKYMNFDVMTLQFLRLSLMRGKSPTDELLTMWGHQNHTVLELFVLLSKMQHYQSMLTLKPFVDPQYHRLIYEGEENLTRIFRSPPAPQCGTLPVCPPVCAKSEPTENNRNVCTPAAGPSMSAAAQPPVVQVSPSAAFPMVKSMEVGLHNLNVPDPSQSPGKIVRTDKKTPAGNQPVEKILNTDRVPVAGQPPSNEENANVGSGIPPVQTYGIRGPPEEKESNIPTPESQKSTSRAKTPDAAGGSSVAENYGSIPHIAYKELVLATNGWDKATILGRGGFGTVFKGTWKNTLVAVKRIELRGGETASSHQAQMQQSLREMKFLNSYRHDNILPLYGYSLDGDEPCLLYQFMPNGSLEDRLLCRNGSSPLSWLQRHNIARGAARGLQFLHTIKEKPLIHGDIKSANILLDQNFEARIGDFGLAREGPNNQYTHIKVSRVHGTRPYLPDEFLRSKQISSKVDTYSFGVVLFELATGLRAYDEGRARKFLKDYVEFCEEENTEMNLIDRRLEGSGGDWVGADGGAAGCPNPEHNVGSSIFLDLLRVGKLCVKKRPGERPEMVVVLQQLDAMAARWDIALRAQKLARLNSLTPSNPYERQYLHDQWQRMSHQRASSPTGQTINPGVSALPPPSHPPSITSTASTVPSPQFLPNPPRFSNNPQGPIFQYVPWHSPSNNPMNAPQFLLAPRVPSVHVHPPSPIPPEDALHPQQGANNGYDGSKGLASQGVPSSMSQSYSKELLPATIPGQAGNSVTEVIENRVGSENPLPDIGACGEVSTCDSQLLPHISLLGIKGKSDNDCGTVAAPVSSDMPQAEMSSEETTGEQRTSHPVVITAINKRCTLFGDD